MNKTEYKSWRLRQGKSEWINHKGYDTGHYCSPLGICYILNCHADRFAIITTVFGGKEHRLVINGDTTPMSLSIKCGKLLKQLNQENAG